MNHKQRLKEFTKLKSLQEKAIARGEKDKWELEKLMEDVKERFGCKFVEEIEETLSKLQQDAEDLASKYDEELKEFLEKYGDKLA